MSKKVTIQDIADALGVSRNTVSRAINNSDGLADSTREKILQKAIEMGYKQFSYVSSMVTAAEAERNAVSYSGEISMLTTTYLSNSHFASLFLDKFHKEVTSLGFTPVTHIISKEDLQEKNLPVTFHRENCSAIICFELFDAAYCRMLSELNVPVLLVDGPANLEGNPLCTDILMMDNTSEITRFVNMMLDRGITRIGFVGNYRHCRSFYERYCAFRLAMMARNVPVDEKFILCPQDDETKTFTELLTGLDELPELFICANDFVAIDAMQILAGIDRRLLENVRFLGFDDSHESRIVFPSLSTVHIHSQVMALSAVQLLLTRINEPSMDYRILYAATDLVLRASTEF